MASDGEHVDTLIKGARVIDGTGAPAVQQDVAVKDGRIVAIGELSGWTAENVVEAGGRVLAPGFIDVHTHDDTHVIRSPQMLPKISQGVTTVIVGNCGISASPVTLKGDPPDPMNLLGTFDDFQYPTFAAYIDAVNQARPAVNVGALIGHTALRNNHMDRLDRGASAQEIDGMRAPPEEVMALAEPLANAGALYTTHMRTEFDAILDAMDEAYQVGKHARIPVVISHLKCAGPSNWGRSVEVLQSLDTKREGQPVGCDCYPYNRSSSTLDVKQVTGDIDITITWSTPHPEMAGKLISAIAAEWGVTQPEAGKRLQPAGAVYHNMSEDDVRRILSHPATMVGSDGLPNDPLPHPRLWGAFPRVLGHYARDTSLIALEEAVRKMTGLSARRFGLSERGQIQVGYHADLVLFDADKVSDTATFAEPRQAADGIDAVWVNGVLSYLDGAVTGLRAGHFVARGEGSRLDALGRF